MAKLNVGDEAPDFTLQNQDGETISLADFKGKKKVVVYFYPKNETPGCTKEACGFRDQYSAFTDEGAEVIGISEDSIDSHKAFSLNRSLPFLLLSDPQNKVRKMYGVAASWLGLVPGRETFVIDKAGIIRHRFSSQLQITQHIEDALEVVRELA